MRYPTHTPSPYMLKWAQNKGFKSFADYMKAWHKKTKLRTEDDKYMNEFF